MEEAVENLFSFGVWVRRRRKALDLTQAALAQQVGCAAVTIRKLEADAFRPSREIADRLASCLKIPPDHRAAFVQIARGVHGVDHLDSPLSSTHTHAAHAAHRRRAHDAETPPASTTSSHNASAEEAQRHNLPAQSTLLIGREQEVADLLSHLQDANIRLLTLTGPGGIGKTRLALQVGIAALRHFSNGVFFVPLSTVTDPLLVASTIAQVLGVQESAEKTLLESLTRYLRGKNLLLILDNFEQILPAAQLLAELLAAAPSLKVLITSRALLHVYGERQIHVPSLSYPDSRLLCSPEQMLQCSAIQLFMDRARAVKPDYPFTETAISLIAQICQRLDGLPLAIELAAARIQLLSPAGILRHLDQALRFLQSDTIGREARHQTLEHTIVWSYELLAPGERTLFRRMALFVGGCTLEAVTAICNLEQSQDLTLLDGVQALLDKSLLKQTISTSGEPRFGMLETIRQFALKQLASSDEHQLVAPRHAEYYLTLAEQAESKLLGAESIAWLDQLETEYGNIRAALEWFKSRPSLAEAGARLAAALCPFWDMQGHFTEGRAWINTMLADSQKLPATILAKALDGAGVLARHQGDYVQAQQMHTQSLAIGPAVTAIARSHLNLGLVAYSMGSTLTAKQHLDTALAILEPEHAAPAEGGELLTQTLSALGKVAREQSDFEQARRYFQEALTLSRKLGNRRNEGQILNNLGGIENHLRHYPEARVHLIAALAIWRTLKDLPSEARTLHNLAVTEQETYHYADAQQHFAAALKVHETTGNRREQINTKIGLGILHYQIGKTDEALLWLQQALALSEEIGADARRPYVLANLGPVLRDLDDLAQAQHWLEEGLALAQIHNDKATQSYCLSHLGMVHLAAGRAAEAINAAYSALLLRRAIGFHAWTSTDLATLAAAHMALTHKEQARAYADESVQLLQEQRTHELELPQRDYFTCYQVYTALGQTERACSSLAVAHALVLSRAANISDPLLKRSFLEGVAINQAIMREAHQVFSSTEHSKHL